LIAVLTAGNIMHYSGNENGTAVLCLSGRFDFSNFRSFRELYEPVLADAAIHTVALNFKAVEYLDSAALGMLLMLRERAEKLNKKVVLQECQGTVRQLLEVAHFDRLFELG